MDDNNNIFEQLNLTFDPTDGAPIQSEEEATVTFDTSSFVEDSEIPVNNETVEELKKTKKQKKERKHTKLSVIIWIGSILLVSLLLAFGFLRAFVDITGILGSSTQIEIVIPQGASTEEIANILQENELIQSKLLFRAFSKFKHADGQYQYGTYYVKQSMGYEGLIEQLQSVGTVAEQVRVTIPERANVEDIAKLLAKNKVCTEDEFYMAMKTGDFEYKFVEEIPSESVYYLLEGYLFPDTYYFFVSDGSNGDENALRAVNKMLSHFDEQVSDEMYKKADKLGYSFHEVMTLASVVELEASAQKSDMPKVAQVFYNRLNKWEVPKLQSDPTKEYFSDRYNTYTTQGLPPGPLCSPSIAAIKAAVEPDTSVSAFYFVTDKDMTFYYSDTLSEHNATINSIKSKGMWAD